jgi:hypothetical protein
VRRVGIAIAEQCAEKRLGPDLLAIALEPGSPSELRIDAVAALRACGNHTNPAALRAVLTEADQPDDELKGYVLSAIWPDALTWDEIAPFLTAPKCDVPGDRYRAFLAEVGSRIQVEQLPSALHWVAQLKEVAHFGGLRSCIEGLLRRGWDELDAPGVLDAFAAAVLSRLMHDHELRLYRDLRSTSAQERKPFIWEGPLEKRRRLLSAIASHAALIGFDAGLMCYHMPLIVVEDDIAWLLGKLRAEADAGRQALPAMTGT